MTYTNKTQPTTISPEKYLKEKFKENEKTLSEAFMLIDVYAKATGSRCVMWNNIFGFGTYYYTDSKGGEHAYLITGFTISKTGFTLYNMIGWEHYKKEVEKLGKYKISGKSCLAIKCIANIDIQILTAIIKDSVTLMKKKYNTEQ